MSQKPQLKLVIENDEFYKKIGRNIQHFRKQKGFTQSDVSQKIGISPQQFQKYEAGMCSSVGIHSILAISEILGISLDELVFFEKKSQEEERRLKKFARDFSKKSEKEF